MARPKKQPPAGANEPAVADREIFLKHLAIHTRDQKDVEAAQLKAKASLKRAQQEGVDIKDMKEIVKLLKSPPSVIATFFSRKLQYLTHVGVSLGQQFDLFNGSTPVPKKGPDYYHAGLMAGISATGFGKPPENLVGEDAQRWMRGGTTVRRRTSPPWRSGRRCRTRILRRTRRR